MGSNAVIRAESLGKKYLIGHRAAERVPTLRDAVARGTSKILRTGRDIIRGDAVIAGDEVEEFWALENINFEINRGDVVGVIGRNGAGKSTLLKILSRITEPTTGRVEIRGRVASLLEVGTGFHPELSGRENIYLNGAILGMKRAEITRKFDEIVAFADVAKFLDTPVKRYSSGMYVRLAFAVAAHLESELLVVDEVLAVGDAEFQKKCLGKMGEVARGGRTVLFVSHSMGTIKRLTRTSIVLGEGRLHFMGPTDQAVDRYMQAHGSTEDKWISVEEAHRSFKGDGRARIEKVRARVLEKNGSTRLALEASGRRTADLRQLRLSFTISQSDGTPAGSGFGPEVSLPRDTMSFQIGVDIDIGQLAPGLFNIGLAVGQGDHLRGHSDHDVVMDCIRFEMPPLVGPGGTVGRWTNSWGSVVFNATHLEALEPGE